jgi:hypothetical protein
MLSMWIYDCNRSSDLPPDSFWEPLVNIVEWPRVDSRIESVSISGLANVDSVFRIKKRGRFSQKREIVTLYPRSRFAERRFLPFATMTTTYSLYRKTHGCEIGFCVEVAGPLAKVWGPLVARRHVVFQLEFVSRLIDYVQQQHRATVPSPHFKAINRNGAGVVASKQASD